MIEDDSPRDQSRNLLENDLHPLAMHGHNILFVAVGALLVHRIQKFPFLIANSSDLSRDRRAVHMHIEDIEKNADALAGPVGRFNPHRLCHKPVGW